MVTLASAAAISPQRELLRAERSSRTLTSYLRRSGSPRGFLGMAPFLPPQEPSAETLLHLVTLDAHAQFSTVRSGLSPKTLLHHATTSSLQM